MNAILADQTVQNWGNSLAVRLNAKVAKAAHIVAGQALQVEVVEGGVFLRVVEPPRETLDQKLARFDPALHGGEVMAGAAIGREQI